MAAPHAATPGTTDAWTRHQEGIRVDLQQPLNLVDLERSPLERPFRLGAVADLIILRPMARTLRARSPELTGLLTSVDLLFGNLEISVLEFDHFKGPPQAESGGTWLFAQPGSCGTFDSSDSTSPARQITTWVTGAPRA